MLVYLVIELWLENYFHTLEHDTSKNDKNVGKQAFLYLGCRHALLIEIWGNLYQVEMCIKLKNTHTTLKNLCY